MSVLKGVSKLLPSGKQHLLGMSFAAFHQEHLHAIIKVTVKHPLSIGSLMSGTEVLHHLVRMQHIASYLGPPLNLLLLSLQLSLLLLTLLQLYVIQT